MQRHHTNAQGEIVPGPKPLTRRCEIHADKPARFPKENPHWCSISCAAHAAYEATRQEWCTTHAQWFHTDDGCYECVQAARDATGTEQRPLTSEPLPD